jgi:Flp pilus assembly protein CpaB
MQRRLFIVIGIVLAVLAIIGVVVAVSLQSGGDIGGGGETAQGPDAPVQEEEPAVPTREVIVAVQPIGRGDVVRAEALGRIDLPEPSIPPNVIENELEAVGQIARTDIVQSQVIVYDLLRPQFETPTDEEAAFSIPPDHVMVAFPIDRQSSVAYAIQPGDVVDVLMSVSFVDFDPEFQTILPNKFSFVEPRREVVDENGNVSVSPVSISSPIDRGRLVIENEQFPGIEFPSEDQRPRRVAQLTVQRARVIRVGPWIDEPAPQAAPVENTEEGAPVPTPTPPLPNIVSLAVRPQDALVLLWARQTQAYMELALRAAGDEEDVYGDMEAVTLQYMLTRFNITVPPKLEFAIDRSGNAILDTTLVTPAEPNGNLE